MFELESCLRYGGITLEFVRGDDTSSFTLDVSQRVIKWSAPNQKGAFEWPAVDSMSYEQTEAGRGLLSVSFGDSEPRLAGRTLAVGIIDEDCWRGIAALVGEEIRMVRSPAQ